MFLHQRVQEHAHREQAEHIRAKLVEQFETLRLLEREWKRGPDQGRREGTRADKVTLALKYLQQALDALDAAASKEP